MLERCLRFSIAMWACSSPAVMLEKTLNKPLEFGSANEELPRFNVLQERLSRPADLFSVSLGGATGCAAVCRIAHWDRVF